MARVFHMLNCAYILVPRRALESKQVCIRRKVKYPCTDVNLVLKTVPSNISEAPKTCERAKPHVENTHACKSPRQHSYNDSLSPLVKAIARAINIGSKHSILGLIWCYIW